MAKKQRTPFIGDEVQISSDGVIGTVVAMMSEHQGIVCEVNAADGTVRKVHIANLSVSNSAAEESYPLQSAEWYAMRITELKVWLKEAEEKANERQEHYEDEGKTHLASRADGFAGSCIRTRRWIEHYIGGK